MQGKAATSKPQSVVGLPDIEICQGREPKNALSLKINPETARSMEHQKICEEVRNAQLDAIKAQQIDYKKPRRRNTCRKKSPKKSPRKFWTEIKKKDDEEESPNNCYIQNILGKYLYTYDEFQKRKRNENLSQTIDVNNSARLSLDLKTKFDTIKHDSQSSTLKPSHSVERGSLGLPPLKTPTDRKRISLRDSMQLQFERVKTHAGLSKLKQTPRLA